MSEQKKIYIAGPAVFLPDRGAAHFDRVRSLLAEKGVKALIPIDSVATGALNIRNKNIDMIKACDAIIADLSPFRSNEPDVGTAFEVGYAAALGKTLLTYSSDTRSMVKKYGAEVDGDGQLIENFDLPFNLMLSDGTKVFETFDAAFEYFLAHHK